MQQCVFQLVPNLYACQRSFFFSSRRRHTRCGRDWSSDVCSSDLGQLGVWSAEHGTRYREPSPIQTSNPSERLFVTTNGSRPFLTTNLVLEFPTSSGYVENRFQVTDGAVLSTCAS